MSAWKNRFAFFELLGRRFGWEVSRVEHGGVPYLDRYILYIGGPTLRLHKFWRGDDDRAPHDHPWAFWTFPFTDYLEKRYDETGEAHWQVVRKFRLHYRPATYRHIVVGAVHSSRPWRIDQTWLNDGGTTWTHTRKPFWTFVVSTNYQRRWGFWPHADMFVPWREWPSCAEQTDILKQRPHGE